MEQLSGLDAAFIHQDNVRTPMHISAVLLYDPGEDGENAISLADLKRAFSAQMHSFPLLRRKLHHVLYGVDTPFWREVPNLDWDHHIRHIDAPDPLDWAAFESLVAQLHGGRMNQSRPLWEAHLIDGIYDVPTLPHRCQAIVLKIHHAAIDGISLARLINELHTSVEPDSTGGTQDRNPDLFELWTHSQINTLNRPLKLAETMGSLLPRVFKSRKSTSEFQDLPPTNTGRAHFNALITADRSVGSVLFPLEEIKQIKRYVRRVTMNDIAMAIVSGALREYLAQHNALPEKSLVAGVPVNLRNARKKSAGSNQIATMRVGLATHISDPVERLKLIHRYALAGKKQIDSLGSGTVMDISDSMTPAMLAGGIRTMAWASQFADFPVPFHTMISNVPGPSSERQLQGARLVAHLGFGPVRDNMGLFHVVSNSSSTMSLSFNSSRELLPDPEVYRDCLLNSFESLRDATHD